MNMSYVEKNLMKNEEILYTGNTHWSYWIKPIVLSTITSALLISVPILLFIPVVILLNAALDYFGREIALTNKRVIGKTGFIKRTSIDSKLDKIDSVILNQGIIARVFGSGTIIISTSGLNSPFTWLDKPNDFRSAVNDKMHA